MYTGSGIRGPVVAIVGIGTAWLAFSIVQQWLSVAGLR